MTDQELITGCLNCDQRCEVMLYKRYYPLMYSVAIRYLKDHDTALYELNYAYLKVLKSLKRFQEKSKLPTWIRKICVNYFIDVIRKENRRPLHEQLDHNLDISYTDQMEYQWEQEELENALKGLPVVTGLVFNLYAIDGYKHSEIAKKLKISEGYSKWHLNQARKQLISSLNLIKVQKK